MVQTSLTLEAKALAPTAILLEYPRKSIGVLAVIEGLANELTIPISIDTSKAKVANRCHRSRSRNPERCNRS